MPGSASYSAIIATTGFFAPKDFFAMKAVGMPQNGYSTSKPSPRSFSAMSLLLSYSSPDSSGCSASQSLKAAISAARASIISSALRKIAFSSCISYRSLLFYGYYKACARGEGA